MSRVIHSRVLTTCICISTTIGCLTVGCTSGLERRFQGHIDFLASDQLQGRGVGTPGIELAASYIEKQFADIGLEPAGEDGTFRQTFEMTLHRTLQPSTNLAFSGIPGGFHLFKDFVPLNFSSDESFSGDVVFCGYGIVAKDRDRDDFVHADIKGKVALMLRGEPADWADDNGQATPHALLRNKVYNAKDRGAVAVLFVNKTPVEGEEDKLIDFEAKGAMAFGIPAFHVRRPLIDQIVFGSGKGKLSTLQDRLDDGGYASGGLKDINASGQAVFKKESTPTSNIAGLLRGQGPQADELVVIGAHYDHLGVKRPMMRRFKAGKLVREKSEPQIHNGADDNASGVSGLIEIARMFASGSKPRRSVLFVAFTAEESGLHGSKHYMAQPAHPASNTIAMLNMDMIGRMPKGSKKLQVFGVNSGDDFLEIMQPIADDLRLKIAPTPDAGGRSDHAPFVRNKIPAMHFFSGQHSDYHKPSDDADKINSRAGAKVTKLVYGTAAKLANQDTRPAFQAVKASTLVAGSTPTYRVVMGLAPGYGDDGKRGMPVEAVNAEGPADEAGMKAGDRIIRIGERPIANIYDYMAATRANNPGDSVDVVILRNGKEVTLTVKLSAAS